MIPHSVTIREFAAFLSTFTFAVSSETDNLDSQSITTSLSESIYSYRHEYGRTYHGKLLCPRFVETA
jgi:hypothetical protein